MLFTESQLQGNGLSILDEATYLTSAESSIAPVQIAVRESSTLGANVVCFDDIHRLAESNGASYLDAMVAVAEASQIDPSTLKVVVDEAEIICNPDVVFALPEASVVISGISKNDPVFQFCEAQVNAFFESGDIEYLNAILDEAGLKNYVTGVATRMKNDVKGIPDDVKSAGKYYSSLATGSNNHGRLGGFLMGPMGANVAGLKELGRNVQAIYNNFKDRPRNVIAKKIASLREVYRRWLERAKNERDLGTASIIQKGCTMLMDLIDKLLALLQRGANKLG